MKQLWESAQGYARAGMFRFIFGMMSFEMAHEAFGVSRSTFFRLKQSVDGFRLDDLVLKPGMTRIRVNDATLAFITQVWYELCQERRIIEHKTAEVHSVFSLGMTNEEAFLYYRRLCYMQEGYDNELPDNQEMPSAQYPGRTYFLEHKPGDIRSDKIREFSLSHLSRRWCK